MASNQGFVSVPVLLDLSAVFDTVNPQILLHRLENLISVIGIALRWLKSYLSDRHHDLYAPTRKCDQKALKISLLC